jgi:hypothetical protein
MGVDICVINCIEYLPIISISVALEPAFDWREHIDLPVRNHDGKVLPDPIIEEYMRGVETLEEFTAAYRRLVAHIFAPSPDGSLLDYVFRDVRNALGPEIKWINRLQD